MKNLRIILNSNYTYMIIVVFTILYLVVSTIIIQYKSKYIGNEDIFLLKIKKIDIDGDRLSVLFMGKEDLQGKYFFKTLEEKKEFSNNYFLGDLVLVKGNLVRPNNNTNPNLFNYKEYLYRNKQFFKLNIVSMNKVKSNSNIFYSIKNFVVNRINKLENSGAYISTFLLSSDDGINSEIRDSYSRIGVSHLLSMANMHISLITLLIMPLFKKRKLILDIIIILFSFFLLFLMDFSASAVRVVVFFVFLKLNSFLKLDIDDIKVLILSLLLIIILKPFIVYNIGFLYSAVISCFLLFFKGNIEKRSNYLGKLLAVSYISFLVGLPITIYNFYEINFLSVVNNLLFVPLVTFIFFPFSVLTFIFPFLDSLLGNLIILIEDLTRFLDVSFLSFTFKRMNLAVYFLYYIIVFITLKKPSNFFILVFILIIHCNYNRIFKSSYMIMLDVGQGDSILFHSNGKTLLFDTGGVINYSNEKWRIRNNSYSITNDTLIPILKSNGISKLNYLIITHGDYDHMGEAIDLVNKYRVENVIFNCGSYNNLEKELIKLLYKKNIKYYSCIKELNMDKSKLMFLNTKQYDNENDNSNVIYFNYNNYKFLLMGDAGIEKEKDILEKYNLNNIDFLKVGHHGSNTSTSEVFINSIKPRYSLISVGKKNKFGHPKSSVLDILKESKIYRTDIDGCVEIKLNKNGYNIKTCSP